MNYDQAISAAIAGKKVRVPEWRGYWFIDPEEAKNLNGIPQVLALTKDGDIVKAWQFDASLAKRTDWEEVNGLDFGWALTALKAGKSVCRSIWDKGLCIKLQVPDAHSKMTMPYMYVENDGERVPWSATQGDRLAEDWELFDLLGDTSPFAKEIPTGPGNPEIPWTSGGCSEWPKGGKPNPDMIPDSGPI